MNGADENFSSALFYFQRGFKLFAKLICRIFLQIMPTRIVQIEDAERDKIILRVEGEMFQDDALLLEKIALQMRDEIGKNITIDLAELDFLDSDGAPVLKRLNEEHFFEIEGLMIFLQKAVEAHEQRNEN